MHLAGFAEILMRSESKKSFIDVLRCKYSTEQESNLIPLTLESTAEQM